MKEIIVNQKNEERIMERFKEVQGKATARAINEYEELERIISKIEMRLYGIPKKDLEGTTIKYNFAQKFPSAYKYTPWSTHFTLSYRNGKWRISQICRLYCPNRSGYEYKIYLSETAKEAVLKLYE